MIHIPTLMLALLSGFAMLGIQLWMARRSRLRYLDLGVWTWGSWILLLGFSMLASRVFLPTWISALAGNGLIALGIVVYCEGIYRHVLGRSMPRWWWWCGPGAAWLLTAWMLTWPLYLRTAAISLVFASLLLPGIAVLLSVGWRSEYSLRSVGITLVMAAASLVLRAVHAWRHPEDYQNLMQSSLGQGLTFLFSFICLIGAGFGFVLANFERVARRMEDMASIDALTGCLNRGTADALLRHELERGRREFQPVALVLLDLDHFKVINDTHGHSAGDTALQYFVTEVRQRLRASDVMGRWGGEEFVLVLPGTDTVGATRLVEQIREGVAALQIRHDGGEPFGLTVSAGIAVAQPVQQLGAEQLFTRADQALYVAKGEGRNRVHVYQEGMTSRAHPQDPATA
ncbi:GGDEF domain-containing protein [Roseateles sp. SL47]|jgi:diguanylate cyclase (GGDEF)-like protein|uniref:GGDEF domain-containing protein n=1 Tax=Roseateles sp. SL47 TaxID=2995138 RepID=UPI00226D9FF0|nr:GGDEF domain-containing protein [Roseateles sp. SL47]WAC74636.1 GGDEF domain-containing protein [Roseateles sp. SL47]